MYFTPSCQTVIMCVGTRRYLRNVSVDGDHQPTLEFNQDGRVKAAELIVVNLRPGHGAAANSRVWEQVSTKAVLPAASQNM
jgi:hypothetical protein